MSLAFLSDTQISRNTGRAKGEDGTRLLSLRDECFSLATIQVMVKKETILKKKDLENGF